MKNSIGIVLFLTFASSAFAEMPMPQAPSFGKKDNETLKRDPILSRFSSRPQVDEELTDALKRGKIPGTLQAEFAKPDRIYEIRVRGAKKIEPDAVLFQITSRVTEEYKKEKVAEDVKNIYKMGLFKEVWVEKEGRPDNSIILTYWLKEKPTIHKIRIEGNKDISEDDIKEVVTLRAYFVADIPRIIENVEKISNLYRDKGYFLTEVDYELIKIAPEKVEPPETPRNNERERERPIVAELEKQKIAAPDFVDVVFKIKESAKVKIDRITFVGNKRVSNDNIKEVMRTKENHPLGIITKWGTYNDDMFEVDLALIEQLYQDKGYLNVKVQKPRVSLSSDKTRLTIHIPIEEGESFRIGRVDIKGDFIEENKDRFAAQKKLYPDKTIFLKSELLEKFTLEDGDVFNRSQVAKDLMAITEMYKDEGYAYVNAAPMTNIHEKERIVDILLDIQAGPRVRIESIEIFGNNKTADAVIRREFRIYEGGLYSSSLLKLSEMRVNQLGYFESVNLTTRSGSKEDSNIVEMEVKERSTGSVQAGAGFGTGGEGFIFQGQVAQNNLFGRGQNLTAQVQWSGRRRIFDIRFVDPYLFYVGDQPMTFAFSVYDMLRNLPNYSRSATGGDLTLGYPIGRPLVGWSREAYKKTSAAGQSYVPDFENLRLFLTYNVERVKITDDLQTRVHGLHMDEPRYTTTLKPTLQFDQRNNRLFPSKGFFLEGRTEFASQYLGASGLADIENRIIANNTDRGLSNGLWFLQPPAGVNNFIRYGFNGRVYYNFDDWFFVKGVVAKMNVDLGLLDTFGKPLLSENYYMGGMNSVRGYSLQTIGPLERVGRINPDEPLLDLRTGGNKQILLNLELEFPIIRSLNISGVLFFDAGNVYSANENFFYIGSGPDPVYASSPFDPRIDLPIKLYASLGFGVRWLTPLGALRFEFGIPLNRRPPGTPGMILGDAPIEFLFNIGPSF